MFFGMAVPAKFQGKNWSKGFMAWLAAINPGGQADISFGVLLKELIMLNEQRSILENQVKALALNDKYKQRVTWLMSIPGIGLQTAMILLTEIGDINRFPTLKDLSAYFGLIPDCHDSGDTKRTGGNTKRGNVYLKYIIIEVSWMCIRYDSSLLLAYKSAVRTSDKNKAIVKVARKLLNRVRFVLKNKTNYQVMMS
jgi:transposase